MALYVGNTRYKVMVGNQKHDFVVPLPYDAEVEWLQSDGNAYIDTGIKVAGNLSANVYLVDFFTSESVGRSVFGGLAYIEEGEWDYDIRQFGFGINQDGKAVFYYDGSSIVLDDYSTYPQYARVVIENGVISIGSEQYTYTPASFTTPMNVILFGWNNGLIFNTPCKMGPCYLSDGTTTLDLIPVRKDGVGYMYDKISGKLFGKEETGNFIIGPDKNLPYDVIMTKASNAPVLAICYAQGWCANENYMTATEAAAVTNIGTVFYNNKDIEHFEEFEYFTGVTSIANNGFRNCTNLLTLTIPENVTSFGNDAFRDNGVKTLIIKSLNIATWGNNWTLYNNVIEYFYSNSTVTSPLTQTQTPSRLTKLKTLVLDSNVRTVSNFGYSSVESVNIAEGVTTFNDNCFKGCSSLESIVLPSTTSVMTHGVFNTCANLTSVTILATTPPTGVSVYTFQNSPNAQVYVPAESVETYKSASGWSQWASRIQAIPT